VTIASKTLKRLLATFWLVLFLGSAGPLLHAETGADAWLRYARLDQNSAKQYATLPSEIVVLGDSIVIHTAQQELTRGVKGMLGRTLRAGNSTPVEGAIALGTLKDFYAIAPSLKPPY
jgi:alpha-glucuronidase